jgi:hypothetical protein
VLQLFFMGAVAVYVCAAEAAAFDVGVAASYVFDFVSSSAAYVGAAAAHVGVERE